MTVEKLGQLIEFNAQLHAFRTESLSWAASDTAAQMDFVVGGNGEAAVGSLLELAHLARVELLWNLLLRLRGRTSAIGPGGVHVVSPLPMLRPSWNERIVMCGDSQYQRIVVLRML